MIRKDISFISKKTKNEDLNSNLILKILFQLFKDFDSFPVDLSFEIWMKVIQLADQHKLIPSLYKGLKDVKDTIPNEYFKPLKIKYEEKVYKSLRQSAEMSQVAMELNKVKIDFYLLKGPFLSVQLHSDLISRQFSDLDIVVNEAHLDRAILVLHSLGYQGGELLFSMNPPQKKYYLRYINDISLMHYSRGLIELHWRVFPPGLVDPTFSDLFRNKVEVITIGGEKIPGILPTYHLLYMIVHGYRHRWYRLSWLWDVVCLFRKLQIKELEEVYELAFSQNLLIPFHQALHLGHELFDLNISCFNHGIHKNIDDKLRYAKNSITKGVQETTYKEMVRNMVYQIGIKKDISYYRSFLMPYMTNYRDWKIIPLPSFLFPLYFVLRPFILLLRKNQTKVPK